jgi:hypothetical protein
MYNDMRYQTNLATTIRMSDETKKLLVRIRSEIPYKDGIDRSMEEIILYLIDVYQKNKDLVGPNNNKK